LSPEVLKARVGQSRRIKNGPHARHAIYRTSELVPRRKRMQALGPSGIQRENAWNGSGFSYLGNAAWMLPRPGAIPRTFTGLLDPRAPDHCHRLPDTSPSPSCRCRTSKVRWQPSAPWPATRSSRG